MDTSNFEEESTYFDSSNNTWWKWDEQTQTWFQLENPSGSDHSLHFLHKKEKNNVTSHVQFNITEQFPKIEKKFPLSSHSISRRRTSGSDTISERGDVGLVHNHELQSNVFDDEEEEEIKEVNDLTFVTSEDFPELKKQNSAVQKSHGSMPYNTVYNRSRRRSSTEPTALAIELLKLAKVKHPDTNYVTLGRHHVVAENIYARLPKASESSGAVLKRVISTSSPSSRKGSESPSNVIRHAVRGLSFQTSGGLSGCLEAALARRETLLKQRQESLEPSLSQQETFDYFRHLSFKDHGGLEGCLKAARDHLESQATRSYI